MHYRPLGRTGLNVSSVSFGAWAIGGTWGEVNDADSLGALHRALDMGVNFFDTADVYGDGRSEQLLARLKRETRETIYIATKAGRRIMPPTKEAYSRANLTSFVERSLHNLENETLRPVAAALPADGRLLHARGLRRARRPGAAGKLRHYGVSVERVEEALKALEYPACSRSRSSSTLSASGRPSSSSPRPPGARWASWLACRWRPACLPAN